MASVCSVSTIKVCGTNRMILTRKQLDKLFQITDHFDDINYFDISADDSETIRVTFNLFDDGSIAEPDAEFKLK